MRNILLVITITIIIGILFGTEQAFAYGGGGGSFIRSFSEPVGGISVLINSGDEKANSREVTLTLVGGSDAHKMAISNSSSFTGASQITYAETAEWTLSEGEGEKTVYVKFYNSSGSASKTVSDSIVFEKEVAVLVAADVNGDGKVDILDFNTLMVDWNKSGEKLAADFNSDKKVDLLDFNLLMVHWS